MRSTTQLVHTLDYLSTLTETASDPELNASDYTLP